MATPRKQDGSWLRTLLRRLLTPERLRFLRFCVVGGSGVLVNQFVLWVFYEFVLSSVSGSLVLFSGVAWSFRLVWAGVLGWAVSVLTNFILNDRWTWGDREKGRLGHFFHRMGQYYLVASAAMVVQVLLLLVLTEQAGIHYLISNLVGIVAGLVINFVLNNIWTFRAKG